jgi:hypothetical protein
MKSTQTLIGILVAIFAWAWLPIQCDAQLFGSKAERPSSEFVPQTAFVALSAFPKKIAGNPELRLIPHEIISAWGTKELGFDPMLINEVTFVLRKVDEFPPNEEPGWAAVLHFEEMQGLSGAMIDKLEEKKIGGKTVFDGTEAGMPSFMVYDESTMIIGNLAYFEEIATASGNGKLVEMIKDGEVEGELQGFVNISPMRSFIAQALNELDAYELPPAVSDLRILPDLINSFEVGQNTLEKIETRLVMHTSNNDDAERVKEILVEGMKFGKTALLATMVQEMDMNDPIQASTVAYAKRIYEKYETKYTPKVSGSDLTIVAHEEIMLSPMLIGLVGNMSRSGNPMFKTKMTPEIELRMTTLASLNYESAYQKFPKRTLKDENGKALFSGRVALLPFMEQNNLYAQLKLDEPWDSEHNSQFTSMAIPAFGMNDEGKATVRFPVFPGSIWDTDEDLNFSNVTDGSSNTIFSIQVDPSEATSWADPTPWNVSKNNPMRDVFGDREEVVVGMLDGSTRTLKKSEMTNEKLKAMLTYEGGEVVD